MQNSAYRYANPGRILLYEARFAGLINTASLCSNKLLTIPAEKERGSVLINLRLIILGACCASRRISGVPEKVSGLSFSRYPAQLYIDISCKQVEGTSTLLCQVIVNGEGSETMVTDILTRKADHIIIEDIWFPFTHGAMEEIRGLLDEHGILQTGGITFRQFMHLRKTAIINNTIRDCNAGEIIQPGFTSAPGDNALSLFDGTLYPYQEDGWKWLGFITREGLGGILAASISINSDLVTCSP